MSERRFDLISVGRCMVDLYCDQIGAPVSEGQSLSMYIGGCPTNVAVGTRRQGLRVAMLTRVGDDATGAFIINTFKREGVDTSHIRQDPQACTPMVVAGIEPPDRFPITWYRDRAGDLQLTTEDYDEAFIASARAILVSGNSLSRPKQAAIVENLVHMAERVGTRVIYDIDYRPMLWYTKDEYGHRRPLESAEVSARLRSILQYVDLLVGTEEEYCALANHSDADFAFTSTAQKIDGTALMKLGPRGVRLANVNNVVRDYPGFVVRVFNTLGAGDAFLSGFLAGWLRDQPLEECARRANASGAIVVTRHGCSPAMPYDSEIRHFLDVTAARGLSPQDDTALERLHVVGALRPPPKRLFVLAIDHRTWFEENTNNLTRGRVSDFKKLLVSALLERLERDKMLDRVGFIVDGKYGESTLAHLAAYPVWVAQPLELAGAWPLQFHAPGGDPALGLRERPQRRVVKVLLAMDDDDAPEVEAHQMQMLRQLQASCERWSRELLLEVLPHRNSHENDMSSRIERLIEGGILPNWWKVPLPQDEYVWERTRAAVAEDDACHGVVFLGGGEPVAQLAEGFARVSGDPMARGFAVGRSLFAQPFFDYLNGVAPERIGQSVADEFMRLVEAWETSAVGA
jgi:5-dehydro-2-deoxygluconokinase